MADLHNAATNTGMQRDIDQSTAGDTTPIRLQALLASPESATALNSWDAALSCAAISQRAMADAGGPARAALDDSPPAPPTAARPGTTPTAVPGLAAPSSHRRDDRRA